jgi:hypothetical protein
VLLFTNSENVLETLLVVVVRMEERAVSREGVFLHKVQIFSPSPVGQIAISTFSEEREKAGKQRKLG